MAEDVQWAQATLWKDTGVHLYLTQQQVSDIVSAVNAIAEASFEQIHVDNTMSVMLKFAGKEVLLHYDGERIGFVFDSATGENLAPGSWSVLSPALKTVLDPILQLDNTKQWISYMTSYDLENLCRYADTVSWEFFEDYAYWDIGSEKRMIPVDGNYYVLAEGDLDSRPTSLYLVENENSQNRIDIRSGDVDAFLASLGKPAENEHSAATGFYSQERAMLDGCVVMQDGDVTHNQENWRAFAEAAQGGRNASITVMHYERREYGYSYTRYDVSFDGEIYSVDITTEEQQLSCIFTGLEMTSGDLDRQSAPYDSYIRYTLTEGRDTGNIVIFEDKITNPDFSQVVSLALHLKQSEPALKTFEDPAEAKAVLSLLKDAEYLMVPPEEYIFGVKLILHTQDQQEMILEVDILQGVYRYGSQYYSYGELSDLFRVLGIDQWPEAVRQEFAAYL